MNVITWLNANAGAIQTIVTTILVLITGYYAYQTRRTVQIMSKSEESSSRPRVAIHINQRENWLNFIDLVIGNYGSGIARAVSFKINNDLELFHEKEKLSELDIIKNGLPTLVPQQVIHIPLLSLIGRIEELKKKDISITLNYKDHSRKKEYSDKFHINFGSLVQSQLGTPPVYEISKNIEGIKKALEKISKK